VALGGTTRLEPYLTPYNATRSALKWSSSDTSIATVNSNGLVSGVKAGSAKITVTDSSGSIKAVCTVTVRDDTRPVVSIALSKQTLALNVGSTSSLTVSVSPSNAVLKGVTWTSNSSAIARVEPGGRIVPVSAGTATITAISDSGAKVASCVVTVSVPVKSVALAEQRFTLKIGETYQLYPLITPSDATDQTVTYTAKSTKIVSVTPDGLITALSTGMTTVTARVGGKAVTCAVTVVK